MRAGRRWVAVMFVLGSLLTGKALALEKNAIFVGGMCTTGSAPWPDAVLAGDWNRIGTNVDQTISMVRARADLSAVLDARCRQSRGQVCQIFCLSNGCATTAYTLASYESYRWDVVRVNNWGGNNGGTELSGYWSQQLAGALGLPIAKCTLAYNVTPNQIRTELLSAGWQNYHSTLFYTYSGWNAPAALAWATPWGGSCRPADGGYLGGCHDVLVPWHSSAGFRDAEPRFSQCIASGGLEGGGERFGGYQVGDNDCDGEPKWHWHLFDYEMAAGASFDNGCPSSDCVIPEPPTNVQAVRTSPTSATLTFDRPATGPRTDTYAIYRHIRWFGAESRALIANVVYSGPRIIVTVDQHDSIPESYSVRALYWPLDSQNQLTAQGNLSAHSAETGVI